MSHGTEVSELREALELFALDMLCLSKFVSLSPELILSAMSKLKDRPCWAKAEKALGKDIEAEAMS